MPLPLVSMMLRLCSTPPHTLGIFNPACDATSMNWTGDGAAAGSAASTTREFFHFQSGVMRASVRVPPSTKSEEPRKRRRGVFIDRVDYTGQIDVEIGRASDARGSPGRRPADHFAGT